MELYLYEQITFELFDFLVIQNGYSKSLSRIAYSSEIKYKKGSTSIRFYYEIGWNSSFVTIEHKRLFKTKVKKIDFKSDYNITKLGDDWLIQNKDSITNKIITNQYISIDFNEEKYKTETRKLLYLREQLMNFDKNIHQPIE